MSDYFTPVQDISWTGDVGIVRYDRGDAELNAQFKRVSEPNGQAAIAAGGPPYVAVDMVYICRPAEYNLWRTAHKVDESHKMRFPRQWAAFQANQAQIPDGYPVSMLFSNQPDRVDHCRSIGIHTVEQLAALSEQGMAKLGMGARDLKEQAEVYLEKAEKRDLLRTQMQIADQQSSEIEELRKQIAAMSAALKKDKAA